MLDKTDNRNKVMVALLPTTTEWANTELPHLTLVFAGDTEHLPPTVHNELIKAALTIAIESAPITIKVVGSAVFGQEEKVDVFLMDKPPELMAMRAVVEPWDTGEFPVYKPHVTIGEIGSMSFFMPEFLTFDHIVVTWGEDRQTYPLGWDNFA